MLFFSSAGARFHHLRLFLYINKHCAHVYKHEEHACTMCNKKFNSSKEAEEHICREGEIIPQVCEKSYCKKKVC